MTPLVGGYIAVEITDINRSASTFEYYLYYGDAQDIYAYILSGSDEISGSSYQDVLIG